MRISTPALAAVSILFAAHPAVAAEEPRIAAEIMAITRAQWGAEVQGKPTPEQLASVADDYTEFNPDFPVRLDGKSTVQRVYEAQDRSGARTLMGEMVSPKVQIYGDVAILTYHYVGVSQAKDGSTSNNVSKSTRVYARLDGQWKLVHANFAPALPPAD